MYLSKILFFSHYYLILRLHLCHWIEREITFIFAYILIFFIVLVISFTFYSLKPLNKYCRLIIL